MARRESRVIILAAAVVFGCSSDGGDINQPSGRTQPASTISIVPGAQNKGSGAFTPNPLSISLADGGLVQWTNNDQTQGSYGTTGTTHNITSNNNAFPSGNMTPGSSHQVTFTAAGTYGYHCSIHPTMVGEVTVTP